MPFSMTKKESKEYVEESYRLMLGLAALKKIAKLLPEKSKILDIGAGGGQDSLYLAKNNFEVIALEPLEVMLNIGKKKAKHDKIKFIKNTFEDFDSKENFDGIWCSRVFHFIPIKEQKKFIKKISSLLKADGILYITAKTTDTRKDYELPEGCNNMIRKRLTRKTFESLLRNNGFRIIDFKYWKNKVGMGIIAKKK